MKQVKKDTLFHFVYHGTDRHGQSITGELNSSSLPIAKAQLRKQGIVLNRIRRKSKPVIGWTSKIKPLDIALFARQLATMTKAGVPLLQALTIVIESLTKANMIELVTSVKLSVESVILNPNANHNT